VQAAEQEQIFLTCYLFKKELKECRTALKIIIKKEMIKPVPKLQDIYK